MRDGIAALQILVEEWQVSGAIPENEWDRMRALDFQEILQSRNEITRSLAERSCVLCGDFEDHVSGRLERELSLEFTSFSTR
jgi:antiviral helicase SKI2